MFSLAGRAIRLAAVVAVLLLSLPALQANASRPILAQPAQPLCTSTVALYDGAQGGTPETQGMLYQSFAVSATQTFSESATLLDTSGRLADYAGFVANPALTPALDRTSGYTLTFHLELLAEQHNNADRAGFSLIALSSDTRGIELAFWSDQVWVQDDGDAEPPSGTLFTHAEGSPFDTTAPITYTLAIHGDSYSLAAGGAPILNGALRDYSAFVGPIDPYETPNFIFVGDDTSSAGARARLAALLVSTTVACPQNPIFLPLVMRAS
jgi:hypothetical protein